MPDPRERPKEGGVGGAGPYSIGAADWNGLSKLVEEIGELGQVLGKIIGAGGARLHWDGSDLRERVREECADVQAALTFFLQANQLDAADYPIRVANKVWRFHEWSFKQEPLPAAPQEQEGG